MTDAEQTLTDEVERTTAEKQWRCHYRRFLFGWRCCRLSGHDGPHRPQPANAVEAGWSWNGGEGGVPDVYKVETRFSNRVWSWRGHAMNHRDAQRKAAEIIDPQIESWLKRGY